MSRTKTDRIMEIRNRTGPRYAQYRAKRPLLPHFPTRKIEEAASLIFWSGPVTIGTQKEKKKGPGRFEEVHDVPTFHLPPSSRSSRAPSHTSRVSTIAIRASDPSQRFIISTFDSSNGPSFHASGFPMHDMRKDNSSIPERHGLFVSGLERETWPMNPMPG